MKRRTWLNRGVRGLALGAILALMVGDGARTAANGGIDPLEVLKLSVKPNIMVVLDSSGSMQAPPAGGTMLTGDWSESKMRQAKQVLKTVVQDNDTKVNFMFGQYTQDNPRLVDSRTGARFTYITTDTSMSSDELYLYDSQDRSTVDEDLGFQAWQDIRPGWGTLYYSENASITSGTPPSVTIDATHNKFYFLERINTSTAYACVVTLPVSTYGTYDTNAELTAFASTLSGYLGSGAVAGRTCRRTSNQVLANPTTNHSVSWDSANNRFRWHRVAATWVVYGPAEAETIAGIMGLTNSQPAGHSFVADSTTSNILNTSGVNTFNFPAIGSLTTSTSEVTCTVDVLAAANSASLGDSMPPALGSGRFFRLGADLATAMTNGMNACTGRGATPNTYSVTWDGGDGGEFRFARTGGSNQFRLRWADGPNNIAGALNMAGQANTALGSGPHSSGERISLLRRYDSYETSTGGTTYYYASSGKFFNGEKFYVTSAGVLCGLATTRTPTNPASLQLARVSSCNSTTELHTVTFTLEGGQFSASNTCGGFRSRVALGLCDATTSQFTTIGPLLDNELVPGGVATDYAPAGYSESQDGRWSVTSQATGGIIAEGSTPISRSLDDLQGIWSDLWNGVPNPAINGAVDAISSHTDPKERTIILFVTDGDDTCAGTGDNDDNALAAAYEAQVLYDPLVGGVSTPSGNFTAGSDPASSVTTYVIGYGNGASVNRLNWIAWGGSGMQRSTTTSNGVTHWNGTPTTTNRTQCTTCIDAFLAPDAATLASVLQSLIDQGATSGAFTAQQSITANVFELAGEVTGYDAYQPQQRFNVIIPTLFQASFELPGYKGHLRAYQNESGVSVEQWDAGQKLLDRVTTGMNAVTEYAGAGANQLTFAQLHGGLADSAVTLTAAMGIRRRIYTTDRNGYYDVIQSGANPFAGLFAGSVGVYDGTNHGRVALWPPTIGNTTDSVAPTDTSSNLSLIEGLLDAAMGLPTDATISAWSSTQQTTEFTRLQTTFGACKGANLNGNCTSATTATRLKGARKEAREIMLAFLAGAEPVLDVNGDPTRLPSTAAAAARYQILYQARTWILAESSLAPPAVVAPPIGQNPPVFATEYQLYANGLVSSGSTKVDALSAGYGLRNPDQESGQSQTYIDTRDALKPAMTTAYIGANDMLHAFRAGPSCRTPGTGNTYATCSEQGGEELWGFLPFDQLGKLESMRKPQKRATKTYVVSAAVRFADVFVPVPADLNGATTEQFSATINGGSVTDARGVWRQVLYFGRGPGGKYLTALDVTNRGAYTRTSLTSYPPIPWWNRGNPDTFDGIVGGTVTHSTADTTAYAKMGETWSVPAIAFVDATKNATTRRPYDATASEGGVGVVAYVGSGYSDVNGEGATFFTLDALNGDPIAAVDVDAQAVTDNVNRTGLSYKNALVAPPAAFSKAQLTINQTTHPADQVTRVYIGDLHGRLWKFVSADPTKAVLMADLGADQAIGVGAALVSLNEVPHVYVAAGNDSRATGPFKFFGFRDDGSDTDTTHGTPGPATGDSTVQVASPAVFLFSETFDTNFRGTLQPATAFTNTSPPLARVFVGGTRFNEPGTLFAPDPYPCRSSFDSVIYAVGAETGGAAYDFGGESFLVLENSRKTALQIIKEPAAVGSAPGTSGGSRLIVDEGLMSGGAAVVPPPPPGEQPKTIAGIPAVSFTGADPTKNVPPFPQGTVPRVCQ